MDAQKTEIAIGQPKTYGFASADVDNRERLNALLAANLEISREKSLYRTSREETEALSMRSPLTTRQAFARFGLLLGAFPPAAIFYKLFHTGHAEIGLYLFLFLLNCICAAVGYKTGKIIGEWTAEFENQSWNRMLIAAPFIGIVWGMMTGAAGGVLFFVFGAMIAAIVGAFAVPVFTIFHRLLKRGDSIEMKHFVPLALGVALFVSAFVLGL